MRTRNLVSIAAVVGRLGGASQGLPVLRSFSTTGPSSSAGVGAGDEISRSVTENEKLIVDAKSTLCRAQAVCFDVDSTVINEESIDALAAFMGAGEAVTALTNNAMSGDMNFEDSLEARLALIRPSERNIVDFLEKNPFVLSPNVEELVSTLHERGVKVFLISGGFRNMILPVAEQLNIPAHRVFANSIQFDEDGEYAGFDTDEPTSRDGGKAVVIRQIKADHGYNPVVMVGDGATDLQSRLHSDAFIGYGGVVTRDVVAAEADWFVTDFQEILSSLRS